jgi:hypothetical protein
VPVQLASFTGTVQNANVRLEWSTLSEVNNYGFFVQRKHLNESAWTDLPNSFIAGHGTTTVPQHYAFVDVAAATGDYAYRLVQVDLNGARHFTEPIQVSVVTSVQGQRPLTFALHQNHPNPFNPTTTVSYQLPEASNVRLIVYDMLGREMAVLVDEKREAGYHEVKFDGSLLSSGVYFCRMQAGTYVGTKKLALTK